MIRTIIEHAGTTYSAELATVERTHLGFEDHGILAIGVTFKGQSWSQGDGLRGASDGFAESYIRAVLPVYGVSTWEDIAGREVFVLRGENDSHGAILGLASKTGDRVVILSEIKAG